MQAVLYVSHGSRVEEARKEAVTFLQSVEERVHVPLQEICFLELAEPDVSQGFEKLVQRGATKIAIIPVLLLSAGHYYEDIPEELEQVMLKYPDVQVTYGKPLGVQERITDILVERIEQTHIERRPDTNILLVGRGSKNPGTSRAIEQIASELQVKLNAANVNVCYLAACPPSFDEGLETSLKEGWSQTFVVPYLWFTGLLMHSMQKKINQLQTNDQQVILCHYLDNHPAMVNALTDRVYEALEQEGKDAADKSPFSFSE